MSYQCTQRMRCIKCKKEGHKAAECFQLKNDRDRGRDPRIYPRSERGGPRVGQNVYGQENETLRLKGNEKKDWNAKRCFTNNLKVCRKLIEFRIDTAADIYIINEGILSQLKKPVKKNKV